MYFCLCVVLLPERVSSPLSSASSRGTDTRAPRPKTSPASMSTAAAAAPRYYWVLLTGDGSY